MSDERPGNFDPSRVWVTPPAEPAPSGPWSGMPQAAWLKLGEYCRWMADRLWLRDWTIVLDRTPVGPDSNVFASVLPTQGRKIAHIEFCREFATLDRDVIKNVVIHELIHLSHRDMTDIIRCVGNEGVLGKQAWDVWWETFRIATEVHVDSMANAFAAQVVDDSLLDEFIELANVRREAAQLHQPDRTEQP